VGEVVSPKSTLKHLFGTGKASQVSPNGEVFVRGYRLGWSRMQKELHGVRISAVDMFVNSMLGYGREVQRHRHQTVRSD
jgi:hypothetical protein